MSVRSWNRLLAIVVVVHGLAGIYCVGFAQESGAVDADHAAKRTKGLELFKTQVRTMENWISSHRKDCSRGVSAGLRR